GPGAISAAGDAGRRDLLGLDRAHRQALQFVIGVVAQEVLAVFARTPEEFLLPFRPTVDLTKLIDDGLHLRNERRRFAAVLFLANDAVLEAVTNDVGLQATEQADGVAVHGAQQAGLGTQEGQLRLRIPEGPVLAVAAIGRLGDGIGKSAAV